MPIEFFCQGCGKRMRTPDGSGGKQGKCPQCGALMAIPTTSRAGATKTSAGASGVTSPASRGAAPTETASDAPIEFDCPSCQMVVRTPAASAGKKGRCPHCREVMQIPGKQRWATDETPQQPAAEKPAAPKPIASKTVQQNPVAQKPVAHKPAPPKPTAQPPAALKPIAPQTSAAKREPIEFYCSSCAGVVRTPATAAGKKGKCPHCSTIVDIPFASDPALSASSGGLTLMPSTTTGLTPLPAESAGLIPLSFDSAGLTALPEISPGLTPLPSSSDLFLDSPGLVTPSLGGYGAPVDPFAGALANPAPLGMDSLGPSAAWQTPAVSTNPYAAPSYAPLPAYGSQRTNGSGTRIATIVCGILTAIYGGFYTLASLIAAVGLMFAGTAAFSFASQNSNLTSNDEARMVGMAAGAVAAVVLFLAMFVIVLIGGIQMARFRKWGLSLAASILCVVPALLACFSFNPCTILFNVPGAALGFWGILMLCNASVKQQFR